MDEITDIYNHCEKIYESSENNLSKLSDVCEPYANRLLQSANIWDVSFEITTQILEKMEYSNLKQDLNSLTWRNCIQRKYMVIVEFTLMLITELNMIQ